MSSSLTISQEFLCPVEPPYFSDEKSTTVEKDKYIMKRIDCRNIESVVLGFR